MANIEVEVKSLLGSLENRNILVEKIINSGYVFQSHESQLNHYFSGTIDDEFTQMFRRMISDGNVIKFNNFIDQYEEYSIRTRQTNKLGYDQVIFVAKGSKHNDSANGKSRGEFEANIPLKLDELDELIMSCDFEYQAKWSRARDEYSNGELTICIDKNAGYGYLAEIEIVVDSQTEAQKAQSLIYSELKRFGLQELNPDRLGRMFKYYNQHWGAYYRTENIFTIE